MKNKPETDYTIQERSEIIKELFDGHSPNYQWYALGSIREVESPPLIKQTKCPGDFGSVEIHQVYGGSSLGVPEYRVSKPMWMGLANLLHKGDVSLRIRGAENICTTLDVDGTMVELYAAFGNNYAIDFVGKKAKGPREKEEFIKSKGLEYRIFE